MKYPFSWLVVPLLVLGCGGGIDAAGDLDADEPIAETVDDDSVQSDGDTTGQVAPHITAIPKILDLGIVKEGFTEDGIIALMNTGLADLVITEVQYRSTEHGFRLQWGCEGPDGEPMEYNHFPKDVIQIIDDVTCPVPVIVAANSSFQVPVSYTAPYWENKPAKAFLTFLSNDPTYPQGLEVDVWANVGGPCLKAEPAEVEFATVANTTLKTKTLELSSCGDKAVDITDVRLTEDSNPDFNLNLTGMGEFSEGEPLILEPGATTQFAVEYLPLSVDYGPDGSVIPDTGMILVDNSSVYTPKEIPINGICIAGECPVADFRINTPAGLEVPDGGEVLAETNLYFHDKSLDPSGVGIVSFEWAVVAPSGSADVFYPTGMFKDPTFEANVVGDYLFRLKVFNKLGFGSCNEAEKLIHVKAGEGCHLELTWSTPNDPDPTDHCSLFADCGSDMDLHVVHPLADSADVDKDGKPDGFFDLQYDCFWYNAHPIWDMAFSNIPSHQPHLDREDSDGAGPENFNYVIPEPGQCYKLGVHYWDDHGFGASYPTLKMFIDGDLVYEKAAPKMVELDMWEVGEACCSDKANPFIEYEIGGAPVIIKQYINPDPSVPYPGIVPLTVGFADYGGGFPLIDVARIYLFKQGDTGKPFCKDLSVNNLPTATVVSQTVSITKIAHFPQLPNLQTELAQTYTVVGLAQAGNGPVQAYGCEDGSTPGKTTTVEWGSETYVELELVDI